MDPLISYYDKDSFLALVCYLEEQLEGCAVKGDTIGLGRALAHYGCMALYLSDEYKAGTVKQQISEEYHRELLDPRIAAGFARFLALYSVFHGEISEAQRYYTEARRWYRDTDWHRDEILTELEANYWLYFYMEKWSESHYTIERWEQVGVGQDELSCFKALVKGYVEKDFTGLGACSSSSWITKMKLQVVDPKHEAGDGLSSYHSMVTLLHEILSFMIDEKWEKADELLAPLAAKARLWKHPWYRALSSYLAGMIRMHQQKSYEAHLLEAKELFHSFDRKDLEDLCQELIDHRRASQETYSWIPMYKELRKKNTAIPGSLFSFTLFGERLGVTYGNQLVSLPKWGRKKAEELFLFLLTRKEYRCLRDQVIEQLFFDEDVKKSSNQLYVTIHRLNQVWETVLKEREATHPGTAFVKIDGGMVMLDSHYIDRVDVQTYSKLVSVGKHLWNQDREVALDLFGQARRIFSTELLGDYLYYDWLTRYREEIRIQQESLLNKLVEIAKEMGEPSATIEQLLQELYYVDPLHEGYAQQWIEYLLDMGKKVEAKWVFQMFQQKLKTELGLPTEVQWEEWVEGRGR